MPEEPMQATPAKAGGGGPERRRATDAGNLTDFRRELLREMNSRDKDVAKELKEQLDASNALRTTQIDANHTEVMGALRALRDQFHTETGKIQATLVEHHNWMADVDAEDAETERKVRETAQRALWEKEIVDKARAVIDARKASRAQVKPYIFTGMGTISAGSVLYVLENLGQLHWDIQTQAITALFALMGMLTLLLVLR